MNATSKKIRTLKLIANDVHKLFADTTIEEV